MYWTTIAGFPGMYLRRKDSWLDPVIADASGAVPAMIR
jgi:hypothetical protein